MTEHLILGAAVALGLTIPLVNKWQIPFAPALAALGLLSLASGLIVSGIGMLASLDLVWRSLLVAALTVGGAAGILLFRFYRDPERTSPNREDLILSPADGQVIYVLESKAGELPVCTKQGRHYRLEELTRTKLSGSDAIVIGISMSLADVHVNRAPIRGRIALLSHSPGRYGSLRRLEMVFENERATTVIDGNEMQVAVVQIASRLVRRISSFVRSGDDVRPGDRIGAIRFGSQVDVVIAKRPDLVIRVSPGVRLVAGESVIASVGPDCAG